MRHRSRFENPDRAARFARRMRQHRRGAPAFLGVLLVSLGVLFLLDNLGLIEVRTLIRTYWPLLLVAWGAARLLFGRGSEQLLGGFAIVGGGILLGNQLLGWGLGIWQLLWPLFLIVAGIHILAHPRWPHRRPDAAGVLASGAAVIDAEGVDQQSDPIVDESATFRESAVIGSVERKNISQGLRAGQVTAFMGAAEIDLRECRMASDEVHVDVSVMMGEVVFRIPRDWSVDSRVSAVAASFEDKSDAPVEASPKRFVVRGSACMGNIEITN
jgi:hypothetical protein